MSAIDRINQKAAAAEQSLDERRRKMRAAMPNTAQWIDDIRQHFPAAYVTHARENGHEVGKKLPQGVVPHVVKPTTNVAKTTTRSKR